MDGEVGKSFQWGVPAVDSIVLGIGFGDGRGTVLPWLRFITITEILERRSWARGGRHQMRLKM